MQLCHFYHSLTKKIAYQKEEKNSKSDNYKIPSLFRKKKKRKNI